jgi:hypothetical protein
MEDATYLLRLGHNSRYDFEQQIQLLNSILRKWHRLVIVLPPRQRVVAVTVAASSQAHVYISFQ